MKYLNTEGTSIKSLVEELYDFSKLGGIAIPNFITIEGRQNLLKGLEREKNLLVEEEREVGSVVQEMKTAYLDPNKMTLFNPHLRQNIEQLLSEFDPFYKKISRQAEFKEHDFNSIGFHFYPKGSIGITPHKDYAKDHNLISIFVLEGKAKFGICENREKKNSIELESNPGTLLLLRAARNKEEQIFRPFHYIEVVEEDRYTLIIRKRISNFNRQY